MRLECGSNTKRQTIGEFSQEDLLCLKMKVLVEGPRGCCALHPEELSGVSDERSLLRCLIRRGVGAELSERDVLMVEGSKPLDIGSLWRSVCSDDRDWVLVRVSVKGLGGVKKWAKMQKNAAKMKAEAEKRKEDNLAESETADNTGSDDSAKNTTEESVDSKVESETAPGEKVEKCPTRKERRKQEQRKKWEEEEASMLSEGKEGDDDDDRHHYNPAEEKHAKEVTFIYIPPASVGSEAPAPMRIKAKSATQAAKKAFRLNKNQKVILLLEEATGKTWHFSAEGFDFHIKKPQNMHANQSTNLERSAIRSGSWLIHNRDDQF